MKIVECVPNFSEGRRPEIIDEIVAEITKIKGVTLIDKEMDPSHNRAVVTFIGPPQAAKQAAFNSIKKAAELIDLNKHEGEHPRMGACDVCPFIPIQDMTTEECVQLAKELGNKVGEKLEIPVFLYEDAATREDRRNLAKIRKGQFEGLRDLIGKDPDKTPDFGPNRIHPTAGAIAIGARFFLIAYNVNLNTTDVEIAKEIAKAIRESGGGFPNVKGMGFELADRGLSQVSMNMTDYRVTSLATVYKEIERRAAEKGIEVVESEIVGLIPLPAVVQSFCEMLKVKVWDDKQIIENSIPAPPPHPFEAPRYFCDELASSAPTPGGGSVAALAGCLAGCLNQMVCNLTIGKKKYAEVEDEMKGYLTQVKELSDKLYNMMQKDADAFDAVMASFKLPKETEEEKAKRSEEIQRATMVATQVPFETMELAMEVLRLSKVIGEKGNKNALSDAKSAAVMARGAIYCAGLNVKINVPGLKDRQFADDILAKTLDMEGKADQLEREVLAIE